MRIKHRMKGLVHMICTALVFMLLMMGSGCGKPKESNAAYYVIGEKDTARANGPSLPHFFYGDHNFILMDSATVFYHDNKVVRFCGTGIDYTKPPALALWPDSLTEIKPEELHTFLEKTIPDSMRIAEYADVKRYVSASISSP
ncbi:MAG: hypothetical protein V4658_00625, partial [Bacteroidota bacterium]